VKQKLTLLTWRKFILDKKHTVVCPLGELHIVNVDEFILFGVGIPEPYAFCWKHGEYFKLDATVDLGHQLLTFKDNPLGVIKINDPPKSSGVSRQPDGKEP